MTGDSRPSPGLARVLILAAAVVAAIATHTMERWRCFDVHELTIAEMNEAIDWLDNLYASPEGLQRPTGLVTNGRLDSESISSWLFQNYLQARADGHTPEEARAVIRQAIQDSPEWRQKHQP
jgi:hypothetical protein